MAVISGEQLLLGVVLLVQSWAITWVRQIDPRQGTFGKESHGDDYKIHVAIISHEVPRVFSRINERRAGWVHDRSAGRIVPVVFRCRAGHDNDQRGSWVPVPAE